MSAMMFNRFASTRRLSALLFAALPALLAMTAASACSPKPTTDDIRVNGPNVAEFTAPCISVEGGAGQLCGVSAMMERRCGSLDCHGFVRRPLRLYSKFGLRRPPDDPTVDSGLNEPGGADTTPEERSANYYAAIGVEPEKIADVAKGTAGPETLLIYKKPLGLEHHKGGSPINKGDDSETCLVSWLKGTTDRAACGKAAQLP